jgi:hypothetical protein
MVIALMNLERYQCKGHELLSGLPTMSLAILKETRYFILQVYMLAGGLEMFG